MVIEVMELINHFSFIYFFQDNDDIRSSHVVSRPIVRLILKQVISDTSDQTHN